MTAGRDDVNRLEAILDAIEEMLLRVPDADLQVDGELEHDAKVGRDIIQAALKADGRRRMEATRRALEIARARRATNVTRLPTDPARRRQLLEEIVTNDNNARRLPERLTMAYRDGKELTDAEVESILAALAKLGLLNDQGDQK
jgi:hypothetical protein